MNQRSSLSQCRSLFRVRVAFLCEDPGAKERATGLDRAVKSWNFDVTFVALDASMRDWFRTLCNCDVVVVLFYGDFSDRVEAHLAAAAVMGLPIIRWWMGSDVLDCGMNAKVRKRYLALNRLVSTNITVAPHLTSELAEWRIVASTVASCFSSKAADRRWDLACDILPRTILVYLPARRFTFYGGEVLVRVAETNPDLSFLIVGGYRGDQFRQQKNVTCMDWVDDMDALYKQIGCILRITEHDGLPRMVLEALQRGRYVIYSWPLRGCWYAKGYEEIHDKLSQFRTTTGLNEEGIAAFRELQQPDPARLWTTIVRDAVRKRGTSRRIAGLRALARLATRRATDWWHVRRSTRTLDSDEGDCPAARTAEVSP
jgi:hypothetical protein